MSQYRQINVLSIQIQASMHTNVLCGEPTLISISICVRLCALFSVIYSTRHTFDNISYNPFQSIQDWKFAIYQLAFVFFEKLAGPYRHKMTFSLQQLYVKQLKFHMRKLMFCCKQSWAFGVCGSAMAFKKSFPGQSRNKITYFWVSIKITYPQSNSLLKHAKNRIFIFHSVKVDKNHKCPFLVVCFKRIFG